MLCQNMGNSGYRLLHLICFLGFQLVFLAANGARAIEEKKNLVHVGLILDFNSSIGVMSDTCISMAISDFYATHSRCKRRLSLHTRNSKDDVGAAFAAMDLINNEEVNAIVGPQTSMQANFVLSLGEKAQVPIISFSATSPSLSTTENKFFIRTAQDDGSQVEPIASLVQAYGWGEAVFVYEDTEYGNGLVPCLAYEFQQFNIRMTSKCAISLDSSDFEILKKLTQLMVRQTRVFVVHMTASLGSRLFLLAKEAGMISEGYAWIITDGISSMLDSMEENIIDSMVGVLGIRPYVPSSRRLNNFKLRWKSKASQSKNEVKLNLLGLWAYDTVWALAMAAEGNGLGEVSSNALKQNSSRNAAHLSGLRVSDTGLSLRDMLLDIKFKGLSGDFSLVNGQLKSTTFEIINIVRKQARVIGYWTPEKGLSRSQKSSKVAYTTSMDELICPVWPGGTRSIPKGWVMPVTGKKMRIGVPIRAGLTVYLRMEVDPYTKKRIISGFSHDVFLAVLDELPFAIPHRLIPFSIGSQNGFKTYDDLLNRIKLRRFDAVVGDITITANRSQYVDFTLPYYESNVAMVVKIKDDQGKNMWIFLKPLSWDLWLTTGLAFIFTGLVVWVLEHRINDEFRGPPDQQVGTICWFSFSILVFAHREKVQNNLSRIVLIIWIFVVLILTQSYTASLASMLTVQRLKPAVADVDELRRNGDFVGHMAGSYSREFLIKQLHFDPSKLRHYSTPEEFDEALSRGSQNGGVSAIFEAEHFLQVFLARYCSKFMTTGPTYKTDGLGFAFPQGSPLVAYMSRAILNVTEDKDKMDALKRKYLPDKSACQDQTTISSGSLNVQSFGGLFIITGAASSCSLLAYVLRFLYSNWAQLQTRHEETSFWSKVSELATHFDRKDPSIHSDDRSESRIHSESSPQEFRNMV
ncbi:hypothetical protein SLE2022_151140 [Rubroshorea leprosula]